MAKRMKKTTIATLTSSLSEAKRTLAPLTKKLESIAALISETEKALGDYQEIADGTDGVNSKSVVSHHINVLVATGYLRREIGVPKSLEVVKRD